MLNDTLLNQVRSEVFTRMTHQNPLALQDLPNNWEVFRRMANTVLKDRLFSEERSSIDEALNLIMQDPYGWGNVFPLMTDKTVNNIWINNYREIMYESEQGRRLWNDVFQSEEHLRKTAERVAMASGRRLDEANPTVDCRLFDGSRVSIIIPPVSVRGTSVTVRKFPRIFTLEDLAVNELFPVYLLPLLRLMVKARLNIFAAGGMGSGKNTFLNALLLCVGKDENLVFIEDPAESRVGLPDPERPDLPRPFVKVYEPRPANAEGKGGVTLEDIFEKALRQQTDRIMVSECRTKLTVHYTLQAMNIGHPGTMSTTHADGPEEVPERLASLLGDVSRENMIRTTAAEVVFFMAQLKEGDGRPVHRRLLDICEIRKKGDGFPEISPLFSYDFKGWMDDGSPVGSLQPTGTRPAFLEKRKLSLFLTKDEKILLESFFEERC